MLDEISLHNKINMLQAEMLKFHEEISPVKRQEVDQILASEEEENKFLSTCIYIAVGLLKIVVCVIGPTLFPAVVYCIEGSSPLFWQVTAVSAIITLLLAMMTVALLCTNLKMVQARVLEILKALNRRFSNYEPFLFFWEVLTSDFLKANIHKVLYPVLLLFVSSLVSYVTYVMKIWIIFYASMLFIGFICGILTNIICDLLRSPELLPFHSPCKIKFEMATPTPPPKVKRELEFVPYEGKEIIPTYRLLTPDTALTNQGLECSESSTVTAVLPNYSPSVNRKETGNTKMPQLPINFGEFFRRFQSLKNNPI